MDRMLNFTLWEKNLWYPFDTRLAGLQSLFGHGGEENNPASAANRNLIVHIVAIP
jgi:hypothetical protein